MLRELNAFEMQQISGGADVSGDIIVVARSRIISETNLEFWERSFYFGKALAEGIGEGVAEEVFSPENLETILGGHNETVVHDQFDPTNVDREGVNINGIHFSVDNKGRIFFDNDGNGKYDQIISKNSATGEWMYFDGDTDGWQPYTSMNSNENGWIGDAWDAFMGYLEENPIPDPVGAYPW